MKHSKRHFSFLILYCWVVACSYNSTCSSAKWHSPVITNHLSVTSRFPLVWPVYQTKFIYLPLVIDFIRRQRSRNFRSLPLLSSIESICAIAILNVCTLTIKASLIQSFREIFSLFSKGVRVFRFPYHVLPPPVVSCPFASRLSPFIVLLLSSA